MSEHWEAFERGRQMFRGGVFRPAISLDDKDWVGPCTIEQCEWLGWMMGRADKLIAEFKARDLREAWRDWGAGNGPMPEEPAP